MAEQTNRPERETEMTDNPWVDGPLGHAIRTRYLVRANRLAATLDAVRPAPRPVKAVKAESEVSK